MSSKSKILRAFAPSRETKKQDSKPPLTPKLRFPEFWDNEILHAKPRSSEEEGGIS